MRRLQRTARKLWSWHGTPVLIWDLQPAAARDALGELAMARTKQRELLEEIVIVLPNLFTPEWIRRLSKTCDVFFRIPVHTHIEDAAVPIVTLPWVVPSDLTGPVLICT